MPKKGQKMHRTSEKVLELLQKLRESPGLHNVNDLATYFGIRSNEIYRWCKYLQERYGVVIEKSNTNYYVPKRHIKLADSSRDALNITLTGVELDALITAAQRIEPLTPIARQALIKLTREKQIENYRKKRPIIYNPLVDDYQPELFERVVKAISERYVAEITYVNAKSITTTYKFNSYVLIPSNQHLHLIGVSHTALEAGFKEPVRLRLDQITSFKLLRDNFSEPEFDAAIYAAKSFSVFGTDGKVQSIKVRFSADKAQFIRRTKRHSTQTITEAKDRSVLWKIHAPISEDLVHWIVSYGPHAKVIAPKELKTRVLKWAKGSIDANS